MPNKKLLCGAEFLKALALAEFREKFPQPDQLMGLNRRGAEQSSEKRVLDFAMQYCNMVWTQGGWQKLFSCEKEG